jgi:hypothetical protein
MGKALTSAFVSVALVFALGSGAHAFTWDKRTNFTFSQPVALPGATLPAGTYTFRLANPAEGRGVINVSNRSGTVNYQLQAMPAYRVDTPKESGIRFLETSAGVPPAIDTFWYVGETRGFRFIYSKAQLAALASTQPEREVVEASPQDLPAPAPVTAPAFAEGRGVPPVAPIEESAPREESAEREALDIARADTEARIEAAQTEQQAAPASQEPQPQTREQLPRTASPLALLLLGGVASALFGVRLLRRA